jgi:hypothetical protein
MKRRRETAVGSAWVMADLQGSGMAQLTTVRCRQPSRL